MPRLSDVLCFATANLLCFVTRAKVVFLKGGAAGQQQLQEHVDPSQLNASFGGTAKEFDPETYFPGGLSEAARAERARFMATL